MAETTAKRRGELVRAVFKVLLSHPDGFAAKDMLKQVEQDIELTDSEKTDYPNRPGVRRFEKRVRFATIKAVKAGWLIKKKGEWTLSETGQEAYHAFPDAEAFEREAHRLYKQWADSREPDEGEEEGDEGGATASVTIEEAEENAWREISDYLISMPPYDFQELVAALLRGMGYHVAWIAPPGKDGGIDIVAYTDPLGTRVRALRFK
jgi:restriction system protein